MTNQKPLPENGDLLGLQPLRHENHPLNAYAGLDSRAWARGYDARYCVLRPVVTVKHGGYEKGTTAAKAWMIGWLCADGEIERQEPLIARELADDAILVHERKDD